MFPSSASSTIVNSTPYSSDAEHGQPRLLRRSTGSFALPDHLPFDIKRLRPCHSLPNLTSVHKPLSKDVGCDAEAKCLPNSSEDVEDLASRVYPEVEDPVDPARLLSQADLRNQRFAFFGLVLLINISCVMAALFSHNGTWVFAVILYIKSKDFLSVVIQIVGLSSRAIKGVFIKPLDIYGAWILSLIPAYSESESQIIKTIFSLRDNGVEPHKQVMCVLLDGQPRDIQKHMSVKLWNFERPYVSLKWKRGTLQIVAGFVEDVPTIVIQKVQNAGKKDSLVLCHDLFNFPRQDMHLYTKLLREDMWRFILPKLTKDLTFSKFDYIFCTDADSTIYPGAVGALANAIQRDKDSIAACGLVLVELEPGLEWSVWNLYQQFQYTFGQFVRRGAEGMLGKTTCLPGCITMISVRPEMATAIAKYARPVTVYPVLLHQVQYLGTDRRLTYSMLSQGVKLRTLFVPESVSETVAPQSLAHYLSQRRRWGSNAYFNNMFYFVGEKMAVVTRVAASIELIRLTLVYYRIFNSAMFIKGLVSSFDFMKVLPLLIISQTPTMWYWFSVAFLHPELRKRAFKLSLGYCINKLVSPFMSVTIFTNVARNLGSQVWGMTGVTADAAPAAVAAVAETNTTEGA